jgi:hypothetical protein
MQYEAARHFSNKEFLEEFIERMSVAGSKPVYKFIHLTTTHWPAVLNDDGEYAGRLLEWTWPHIFTQAKYSFDDFMQFVRRLRELSIYDRSLIIVQGDHGYWKIPRSSDRIAVKNAGARLEGYAFDDEERFAEIVSSAMPLLAIKRPYAEDPLKRSTAPAALTDLPTTICAVQGLPSVFSGRSVFDIDPQEVRERTFSYYDSLNGPGDDYFDRLDRFSVRGDPLDKASWHFAGHLHAKRPFQAQEILMGGDDASRLLLSGWSWPESSASSKDGSFRWALGSQASLWVSLPKDRCVRMTATVKSLAFPEAQTITVNVDGKNVAAWRLTPVSWNWEAPWTWEKHTAVIEPDRQRPDVSTIEFGFSRHHVAGTHEGEQRPLAVLFQSLSVQEMASASSPGAILGCQLPFVPRSKALFSEAGGGCNIRTGG